MFKMKLIFFVSLLRFKVRIILYPEISMYFNTRVENKEGLNRYYL